MNYVAHCMPCFQFSHVLVGLDGSDLRLKDDFDLKVEA